MLIGKRFELAFMYDSFGESVVRALCLSALPLQSI